MDIIYSYTRAQAIEDGVLIDVTETAKEAGFVYPVAVTAGVWAECIAVQEYTTDQDEAGRLWDVLWMLRCAIARPQRAAELGQPPQNDEPPQNRVTFELYVKQNDARPADVVRLWSLCGLGDDAKPVITIMLPNED